jgi:hypothetical protein
MYAEGGHYVLALLEHAALMRQLKELREDL